ncbi:MAG: N-acetylmuramoyl-L-alanine amidase, partial [Deferribacteraceae bacterium]|nr:N-acetylmuramoyl-L-alanine amidase [Deferribacteraceae bacterium]
MMKRTAGMILSLLVLLLPAYAMAADSYESLFNEYSKLSGKSTRLSYVSLGDRFFRVYAASPNSKNADYALLYAGKTYKQSFEIFKNRTDSDMAVKYLRIVSTNYTTDAAADAYLETADIYIQKNDLASAQFTLNRLKNRFPGTAQEEAANNRLQEVNRLAKRSDDPVDTTFTIPPAVINAPVVVPPVDLPDDSVSEFTPPAEEPAPADGTTVVKEIRYFSNDEYTRIVVDLSQNAKFEKHWLKANKEQKLPPRLFIDIQSSTVQSGVPTNISIKDGLVSSVRWAYNKPGVTRIVLDSEAIKDFTVFQMGNPSRIVIDVRNDQVASTKPATANKPSTSGDSSQTLAGVFGLKVRTIVIDPGHGGKDPGTVANGVYEKTIVLEIAKHLRDLLKADKDLKIYLTRETDKFIPLEERTAIANKYKADLFISVHINATKNGQASGIETYVLNTTNDKSALDVAAFENQATTKSMSDLQGILKDIMLNSKLEESLILAGAAQRGMVANLKLPKAQDLGVKQAPFYVLTGANMPA